MNPAAEAPDRHRFKDVRWIDADAVATDIRNLAGMLKLCAIAAGDGLEGGAFSAASAAAKAIAERLDALTLA